MFGVADEAEIAELQRLKLLHPEVVAAIEACENWMEDYAQAHGVAVPEGVKNDVLDVLSRDFEKPPYFGRNSHAARHRFYGYLAAASLVLLVVSAGFNFYFYHIYQNTTTNYAILSSPGVVKIPLPGVKGKENNFAVVYWNVKTKDVYLQPVHLLRAPAGKQYQLWALVEGKPINAGLFENSNSLCRLKPVLKADAFAITLENAGGSSTPTLSQLCVLGNVKS